MNDKTKIALEALTFAKSCIEHPDNIAKIDGYIAALQAQEAEPAAWFIPDDHGKVMRATGFITEAEGWQRAGHKIRPLYAHPTAAERDKSEESPKKKWIDSDEVGIPPLLHSVAPTAAAPPSAEIAGTLAACLDDDAALLMRENPHCEIAANMMKAADLLEAAQAPLTMSQFASKADLDEAQERAKFEEWAMSCPSLSPSAGDAWMARARLDKEQK